MTEIAIRQPAEVAMASGAADLDSWIAVVQDVSRLADAICDTDFVPKAYRGNAPAAMAAILTGRELGLPPMTALRHVQLVEGSASLSAEYKRARVLSAGHEFDVLEATNTTCTVSGRRRGSNKPPLVITYTIEDARRANLIKDRGGYQRRPRRMLFARAGTELCDFLFADVTNGLPTTELLAEDSDGVSGYDEQPAEAARPTGRVTAGEIIGRRQAAPPAASPAVADSPPPQPSPPAEAAGEAPMPPLPGEDEPAAEPDETSSPDRHRKLVGIVRQHFKRLGYTDDDTSKRISATAKLAGTSGIGSTNDLDEEELSTVADALARCKNRAALDALVKVAGDVPGADDE